MESILWVATMGLTQVRTHRSFANDLAHRILCVTSSVLAPFVAIFFVTSSFLFLAVRPGATSCVHAVQRPPPPEVGEPPGVHASVQRGFAEAFNGFSLGPGGRMRSRSADFGGWTLGVTCGTRKGHSKSWRVGSVFHVSSQMCFSSGQARLFGTHGDFGGTWWNDRPMRSSVHGMPKRLPKQRWPPTY